MNINEITEKILEELRGTLSHLDPAQADALIDAIQKANRIFVAGAGRSRLMIRGLAMRLMHLGLTAYVAGETTTPAIRGGDLLIIASGSGETATMRILAEKAKTEGAHLALITIYPQSSIGRMADEIIRVSAATTNGTRESAPSFQPGASTFEQCVLLIGDALVIRLIRRMELDDPNGELKMRHANLE